MLSRSVRAARPLVRSYATAPAAGSSFKGGFTGFLLGATVASAGLYYYLILQYDTANAAVLGDVLDLEASIKTLEQVVLDLEKKSK